MVRRVDRGRWGSRMRCEEEDGTELAVEPPMVIRPTVIIFLMAESCDYLKRKFVDSLLNTIRSRF